MTENVIRVKEVANDRPLLLIDQFLQAQGNAVVSKAADENAIRNSWAKKSLLLTEVAEELDGLLEDEAIMNVMGIDRHERLMNLLYRVRKS